MQFLKTLFWVLVTALVLLFSFRNWTPVTISLWDDIQADVKMPVLLLIFFLVRSERWSEAMNQLVHVDGHVGALPWTLTSDPAADYAIYRALAVAGYEANGGSPATLPH